jgi:integrase
MQLTDIKIKAAKPGEKVYKIFDGRGLYLRIEPSGTKLWRLKYHFGGREKHLALGVYDDVSLAMARKRCDEARKLIADNKDPGAIRREAKRATISTFAACAEAYLETRTDLAPRTLSKARWQLRDYLNPVIGDRPINEITAPELLGALRQIEKTGHLETAHKSKELAGRVFMFAIAEGVPGVTHNPAADLKFALKARPDEHYAAITKPAEVGQLMRDIEDYSGQPVTHAALRLLPHVFLRSKELRFGKWSEIDWDNKHWLIPAERMKGKLNKRTEHIVPLSRQAMAILKDLHQRTGKQEWMFPTIGYKDRPISENTLGKALHRLGYTSDVHVPHGFRSTASTLLHDLGHLDRDIELQLHHGDQNKVRGIYNRAERLDARREMMQQYSDYLDQLRDGGKVVAIHGRSSKTAVMKSSISDSAQRTA